jgi:calcium/calmodulin-dependent protein kinase I
VGSHRETGEVVAIKQLPKKAIRELKVMTEVDILRLAGEHRNIIGFRDLFQDEENWYIVMEMAEGGELFDRLVERGAYSEAQASEIMREIVDAVSYLHQQGIVHCDLKPENLLLATKASDTSNMRLVDFGSAFRADSGKLVSKKGTGTIAYSAPEVISGRPCGYKADVWALGVLMYILLSGTSPSLPPSLPSFLSLPYAPFPRARGCPA